MAWVQALALLSALAGTTDLPDLAPGRLVTVYGEAEELVAPDIVSVNLSLQAEKPSADASFAAEGEAMAALQAALKAKGVAPQDMRTLGPAIDRVNRPTPLGSSSQMRSNSVREFLSVSLYGLDKLPDVVRAAESQGAEVESLRYDIATRVAREDALRAAAVEDARRRARIYAQAAGLRLGEAHALVEERANLIGAATRLYQMPPNLANPGGATAITLTEGVYVSFELLPK